MLRGINAIESVVSAAIGLLFLARTDSLYYCKHMKEWALLSLNGENKFYSFTGCYLTKEWSSLCYPLVTRFLSRRRRG